MQEAYRSPQGLIFVPFRNSSMLAAPSRVFCYPEAFERPARLFPEQPVYIHRVRSPRVFTQAITGRQHKVFMARSYRQILAIGFSKFCEFFIWQDPIARFWR